MWDSIGISCNGGIRSEWMGSRIGSISKRAGTSLCAHKTVHEKAGPLSVARLKMGPPFHNRLALTGACAVPALLARSTVRIFEKIPQERFFEGSSKILSIVGDSVGDGIVQSTAVSTMRTPAANRRTTVSCTLPPHDMSSRQCRHMHTCTLPSHAHCRHIHIAITYTLPSHTQWPSQAQRRHKHNAVTRTTPSHVQRRHMHVSMSCTSPPRTVRVCWIHLSAKAWAAGMSAENSRQHYAE